MSEIVIVATLTAQPGSETALEAILSGLVAPSRAEAGCLQYDLHRDPANPAVFAFIETWASREAHQAHLQTAHFRDARGRQEGLVAAREERFMEKL